MIVYTYRPYRWIHWVQVLNIACIIMRCHQNQMDLSSMKSRSYHRFLEEVRQGSGRGPMVSQCFGTHHHLQVFHMHATLPSRSPDITNILQCSWNQHMALFLGRYTCCWQIGYRFLKGLNLSKKMFSLRQDQATASVKTNFFGGWPYR